MKKKFDITSSLPLHIVWIQTGFLGDIVINTGAFALVKKYFPHAVQVLITTPVGAQALVDQPYLDDIAVFHKRGRNFFSAARSLKKSLIKMGIQNPIILQVHKSIRSTLLANYLGGFVVAYKEAPWSLLSHVRVPRVAVLHECYRQSLLLEPLGISRQDICKAVPEMTKNSQLSHLKWKEPGAIKIGVAPGSVWGTKRWPAHNYAELVGFLLGEGYQVILLGSENEKKFADEILNYNKNESRLIDLCGKTSLGELPQVYENLDYLVANDSSPIHYGSAFAVPTLAIFGATMGAMGFGPLAPGSIVVERSVKEVPCRPCSDHGPKVCPLKHFACMNGIGVRDVIDGFKELMARNQPE